MRKYTGIAHTNIAFEDANTVGSVDDVKYRHRDYKGRTHRSTWNREFIGWDGEGIQVDEPVYWGHNIYVDDMGEILQGKREHKPQPYILLANSKGQHISNENGLSTTDCLNMLLACKQQYRRSIFVGFALNYDVNQILKDLPLDALIELHDTNEIRWAGYKIQWYPGKSFWVKYRKQSAKLWDVFGFFQQSFLKACKEYLGEDDPELQIIAEGKAAREQFTWGELESFILPYCRTELSMLVRIMDILRKDLYAVGIKLGKWQGPGAIAERVFEMWNIPISRDIPEDVLDASQFAYAGGRFETFRVGRYPDTVWEYDLRSAYPAAATKLPDISKGRWELVERFEPGSFGVWLVDYRAMYGTRTERNRPQPLFCRSSNGSISYPNETQGWYWTPEAELVSNHVVKGWVFRPYTNARPFAAIKDMYEQRRVYRSEKNPCQRALKLALNSIYGKTAQCIGGKEGPPRWHQLEYAGYITSYVRAQIYRAIQLNPDAIIAVETDAVFSTAELDLDVGEALGQWEVQTFDEICYIQSGFYYALTEEKVLARSRGMDIDRTTGQPQGLPYRRVLDHLLEWTGTDIGKTTPLSTVSTRYIGLGLGLKTQSVWRSWEKTRRIIHIDSDPRDGKRYHLSATCPLCRDGVSMARMMHPTYIGGYSGKSHARAIPWRLVGGEAGTELALEEELEMDPSLRDFAEDMERWQ